MIVTIGKTTLTPAQADVVRSALIYLKDCMCDPEIAYEVGPISSLYKDRASEILKIIFGEIQCR